MSTYQGHYDFTHAVVTNWNSTAIGVYYCGAVNTAGVLEVHYVGIGTSEDGIRGRLLDHLRDDWWTAHTPHFGYAVCATPAAARELETKEIKRLQPKYNTQQK